VVAVNNIVFCEPIGKRLLQPIRVISGFSGRGMPRPSIVEWLAGSVRSRTPGFQVAFPERSHPSHCRLETFKLIGMPNSNNAKSGTSAAREMARSAAR
jgi:hypothetical protein